MNAGGVLNTCKLEAGNISLRLVDLIYFSGGWVSNAWVTCLIQGITAVKWLLILHKLQSRMAQCENSGIRWTRVDWGYWRGNGSPRRRSIAGLRVNGHIGTETRPRLRECSRGILHNGETDAATPREGRSISVCKLLSAGKIVMVP